MQCKDIPTKPILEFLATKDRWCTHGDGYSMPTVQDVMPAGTPRKLQLAKMSSLLKKDLVEGCDCGCRGDWQITFKGLAKLYGPNLAGYPEEFKSVLHKKLSRWAMEDRVRQYTQDGYRITNIRLEPGKEPGTAYNIVTFKKEET